MLIKEIHMKPNEFYCSFVVISTFSIENPHFRKNNKQFCYNFAPFRNIYLYLQFVTHLNQLHSFNFQTHATCNYKRARSATTYMQSL